jgi:hypothetical protein
MFSGAQFLHLHARDWGWCEKEGQNVLEEERRTERIPEERLPWQWRSQCVCLLLWALSSEPFLKCLPTLGPLGISFFQEPGWVSGHLFTHRLTLSSPLQKCPSSS